MGLPRHHGRDLFAVSGRIRSPPSGRVAPDIWALPRPHRIRNAERFLGGETREPTPAARPGQRERVIAQRLVTVPSPPPRGSFETASRQPRSILAAQRRGSNGTDLSAHRHRVRGARRRQEGRCLIREGWRASSMRQCSTRIATRVSCSSDPWRLRALGVHPLSFLNDLSRPSTPSNPRSFGPSCRFAAAHTTPLIGVPLRVCALRWRRHPGRL
jgi:hypothetical protein